jgi:predicted phage tail protein
MTTIIGAGGGGKGGGGSSRSPKTTPDSLDSRQYATVLDLISEGEIEGLVDGNKSIFLNGTALQNAQDEFNFEDVTVYTRNGTQAQTYIPITSGTENERSVNRPVTQFVSVTETITDDDVDAVRVTVSIPSLQKINNKTGDTLGSSVRLKIFAQYAGGGFGDALIDDTISGRTADLYQKDYLVTLNRPNATDNVDIKVERVTEDSNDALLTNAFSWSSMTEIKYAKLRYPNSALIALRVDAEQFSSIPTRKYLVKGVKVKIPAGVTVDSDTGRIIYPENFVWNGTFAAATWTSCPAFILYDLLTNTRYGFGNHVDTAQIDKYAFFAASKYSNALVDDGFGGQEARFSCNTTIQTAEESFKLVNDLLSVMRCQGFWAAGSLTIEQDAPKDAAYLFTNANVTEEGFNYSGSSLKTRPTVVVVSYLDIDLQDTAYEVVEDHDGIAKYGVVRKEFSAFACTSRGQAARIGKWILYSEKYEKEVVSFTSSLDAGQTVRPGQIIQIADPVISGARKGGRIKSATSNTITVDDTANTDLTFGAGSFLYVILPDGTVDGEVADEKLRVTDITNGVITVDRDFAATPNANSIWVLETLGTGATDIQPTTWRVLSIEEQDNMLYTISAVAYNASKYAFVEDGEALQTRDTTNLDIIPEPPEDLEVLATVPVGGTVPTKEVQFVLNGQVAIKITWHWRVPAGQTTKRFRVRYRHEDDNFTEVIVQGTTFDILDAKTGNYQVQVSCISSSNILFSKPALANYTVQGLGAAPNDIRDLSLTPTTDTLAILSWKKVDELDVQLGGRIVIRHDPRALASAEWNASNRIVDSVSGISTQKQVPLLAGTYFVKAEDFLGVRSETETAFEVSLPQPEARYTAKTYAEHNLSTPFNGTKTNCSVVSGNLDLVPDPYVALGYADNLYFVGDGAAEYQFQDAFDFGDTFDFIIRRSIVSSPTETTGILFDARSGLFDDATGLFDGTTSDVVNVVTYFRTATAASPSESDYTPWAEFVAAVVQGRHVQIKAELETTDELTNVSVDQLGATLELARRTETGTGTSGNAVTFDNAFHQTPEVIITPTNLGADGFVTLTKSTTGFTATLSGASNTGFSYTATGFGRAL